MSRQIVLDTETTGLSAAAGHRIIEIGCVELVNRRPTGRNYHRYLQPDRDIESAAQEVHGITAEHLADAPRFADIAAELIEYLQGAELIIHNAVFDVGFLDAELARLGEPARCTADLCGVLDTLLMARRLHPGARNSLDALCKRYGVDNAHREVHGALLDAGLLADVYLAMTGGQATLLLDQDSAAADAAGGSVRRDRPALPVPRASAAEGAEHRQWVERLDAAAGTPCAWHDLDDTPPRLAVGAASSG